MLFSIALAPGVLRPPAAHPPPLIRSLSAVLHAVTQNGILVCSDVATLRADLIQSAKTASGSAAQTYRTFAEDFAKDITRYAISPGTATSSNASELDPCAKCISAARWGTCDAVVVSGEEERQRCIAGDVPPERIVLLEDFGGSALDLKRSRWRETQRLDTLTPPDTLDLVGRAIRFSKKIIVADKMIGVSIKTTHNQKDTPYHRAERVAWHLGGLSFLVEAWKAGSPFAVSGKLNIEVVTVAGQSGARGGFIDQNHLRAAFEAAKQRLGLHESAGQMTLTLKRDDDPSIFNYRLLVCGGRTWGLEHGLDDFGKLTNATKRRPTVIDPSSEARASIFRDYQGLPSVEPPNPGAQKPS